METPQWTKKRLIYHWTATTGNPPDEGSFTPKGETLETLEDLRQKRGDEQLDEWLGLAMAAFLHRTRGSSQKFFINSYLFSETALEYLKEFKKNEGAYAAFPNNLNIRSRILMSETDFLDTIITINVSRGSTKSLDLSSGSFKPDIWWMLSAEVSGRMKRKDFPEHWMTGTYQITGGNRITVEDEYSKRRMELKSSTLTRDLLLTEFKIAVVESTISWLEGHKLAVAVSEEGILTIASSKVNKDVIPPSADPSDRDLKLVSELCSVMTVPKIEISKASKSIGGVGSTELIRAAADPIVQKLLKAAADD